MAIREDIVLDPTKGISALDEMDRATVKYARKQERLWKENQESIDALGHELKNLKRLRDTANDPRSVKRYNRAIEKLENEQQQLRKEAERYGRTVSENKAKSTSSFKAIGASAKAWIAGAAVSAFYLLQQAMRKVLQVGGDFQQGMAEVSTLVDTAEVSMGRLEQGIQNIATEVEGVSWTDLPKALYQTISAGVDASQALDVVRTSARSAVAGVTDVSTAVDGITTAINAWGLEAEQAEQVSDSFFTAVKAGKTTFDELSKTLGRVAPLAETAGVSLDTVLSAVAALTTGGMDTAQAMTALRGVINKVIKPTQQARDTAKELGVEFNTAALEAKGLEGFLNDIKTAAGGNTEAMGRLFEDVEGLVGVLSLAGNASGKFNETLAAMDEKAGSTDEAFEKMRKSFNNLYQIFTNKLNRVMVKFANQIMPSVIAVLEDAGTLLDSWAQENKDHAFIDFFAEKFDVSDSNLSGFFMRVNEVLEREREIFRGLRTDIQDYMGMIEEYDKMLSGDISESKRESILRLRAQEVDKLQEEQRITRNSIQAAKEMLQNQKQNAFYQAKWNAKLQSAREQLEFINGELEDVSRTQKEVNNEADGAGGSGGGHIDYVQSVMDEYEKYLALMDKFRFARQAMLPGRAGGMQEMADLISEIERNWSKLGDTEGSILGLEMQRATRNVQNYNAALTEANNELQSGTITQEEYHRKVSAASEKFLDEVKKIYRSFKDQLTPAQETFFEELLGNIEDTTDESENMTDKLDDLADMADSLINVADALGAIGDKARQSLTGVADLLRNASKLSNLGPDAGVLDKAIPGIGIASGLITTFAGLLPGGGDQGMSQEELKKLNESIFENKLALERNTRAIEKNTIVASEARQSQVSDLEKLFDKLLSGLTTDAGGGWQTTSPLGPAEVIKILQQIESIGKEAGLGPAFQGLVDQFKDLVKAEGGDVANALQRLLKANRTIFGDIAIGEGGLADALQKIINQFRQYGDSIDGALQQFRDSIKLGGLSTEEAFKNLITKLREVGVPDEVLQSLQSLDITTEEGKKRLNEIIKQLFDREDIGELNQSEWQDLLEFLKGLTEGDIGGAKGEEAGGYSRSVQIARTITDVQANEMIMFLERIEKWTRDSAAALGSRTAISVNETGGAMPNLSIPIPLPVKVVDGMADSGSTINQITKALKKNELNLNGDINLGGGVSEQDIDELANQFAKKLKQQVRGEQF